MSILLALPCFSSVLQSENPQVFVFSREIPSGFLSHGSLSAGWGGIPHLVTYIFDQSGEVTSQTTATFAGEPVCATDHQSGSVLVCVNCQDDLSRVVHIDDTAVEEWITVIYGESPDNSAVCSAGSDVIFAGDNAGILRVIRLGSQGTVLWDTNYPSVSLSVRDVCAYNGEVFVLGTNDEPEWERNGCLLVVDSLGESSELHTIFSGEGRFSPEAIAVDSRGLFILVNAMTPENNMIYEVSLVKLNFELEIQWTSTLTGASWDRGTDLIALPNGGFVVCGWTNSLTPSEMNRSDMILCAFSENGAISWERTYGTSHPDYGLSLSAVSDGGFLISGCVTDDSYQGWLVKTDSLGFLEPQGISEFSSSLFSAIPLGNPVKNGSLSFLVNTPDSGSCRIVIYDMTGRVVLNRAAELFSGENNLSFSAAVPSGIYSVRVSSGVYQSAFRFVVCEGGE
ncbi:MAG: T9SS type A sorting domain-containing protein [Candidatus Sabulitectum sp.]|nr:T9SS type A sorting domain-containing protein [Candidatus Sabulitectum sp.]